MTIISLIATTSADAASGNVSITHGLTIQANDVIVATVNANLAGNTVTDNNGSTPFTVDDFGENPDSARFYVFHRVCGGSEPSAYNFTLGSSDRWSIVLRQYRGVDPFNVWDIAPGAGSRSTGTGDTTAEAPSGTISNAGACGLVLMGDDFAPTTTTFVSVDNGYGNVKSESGQEYQATADKLGLLPGSTGITVITSSATVTWVIYQVALKPEPSTGVPIDSGVICLWTGTNASIPSGWSRETALDAKYVKGSAAATNPGTTGGALTHSHTTTGHVHTAAHTHTVPNSPAASGSTNRDAGSVRPISTHTHVSNPATANPATSLTSGSPSTDAINHEPAYYEVIYIKSDGTPSGFPNSAVVLWNDSTQVPTGWGLTDGGGGRPDMRNKFIKGAAAAGDGGGTGGADTHTHTVASHDHGTNFSHAHPDVTSSQTASSLPGGPVSGANAQTATQTHTHALTIGNQATDTITANTDTAQSTDHKPAYTSEAFIQNTSGDKDIHIGMIALWIGTLATIPPPWSLCDGTNGTPDLRDKFVRGANTLGDIGGTGGSATHGHTATGHTHAVASHAHTVAAAAGAQSNETAGATAVSTGAHTHPAWSDTGASSFTSGNTAPTVNNYTDTQPPFYTVAFIQLVKKKSPPPYQKHTLYIWRPK